MCVYFSKKGGLKFIVLLMQCILFAIYQGLFNIYSLSVYTLYNLHVTPVHYTYMYTVLQR